MLVADDQIFQFLLPLEIQNLNYRHERNEPKIYRLDLGLTADLFQSLLQPIGVLRFL